MVSSNALQLRRNQCSAFCIFTLLVSGDPDLLALADAFVQMCRCPIMGPDPYTSTHLPG